MPTCAYLIDRDGVLNRGAGSPLRPEAVRWIDALGARGIPFLIATNHSTSSPEVELARLRDQGLAIDRHQLHTPVDLLATLFGRQPPGRMLARGAPALLDHLRELGIELTDDAEADTVLLAFDRTMSYAALANAIAAVHDHGARLIALHENRLFRDATGRLEPGLGAWVRAIEYATGREALIVGKPSATYYRAALERLGATAQETTMISDDPFGDLAGAKALGMRTVFVLSGTYADRGILASPALAVPPDRVVDAIETLAAGAPLDET